MGTLPHELDATVRAPDLLTRHACLVPGFISAAMANALTVRAQAHGLFMMFYHVNSPFQVSCWFEFQCNPYAKTLAANGEGQQ